MMNRKIMLVGSFLPGALEHSYYKAFEDLGCDVCSFDILASEQRNCRLGKAGKLFNKFIPVEPWIRKSNREMVLLAQKFSPHVLVVFGQNRVLAGALAQIHAMLSLSIVYIWPDPLINLNISCISTLPLFDLICTYSLSTIPYFEQLGGKQVVWLPFGADSHMHPIVSPNSDFQCDISFIGQWRPEREQALAILFSKLHGVSVKIWGPDWGRRTHSRDIRKAWQKRPLFGNEFAQAVASSKINLNIIDDTNYPAVNMRFFEIPCAAGMQICSYSPEMESVFRNGETVFYFSNLEMLPELVQSLLNNKALRNLVAQKAHSLVMDEHTYIHRVKQILSLLK